MAVNAIVRRIVEKTRILTCKFSTARPMNPEVGLLINGPGGGQMRPKFIEPRDIDYQMANSVLDKINQQKNSNLQFVKVVSLNRESFPLRHHMLFEASDPDAGGALVNVKALYNFCSKEIIKYNTSKPRAKAGKK